MARRTVSPASTRVGARYAGGAEAIETAIARDPSFREHYAIARERWLAGERDVVWPVGTWAMKRWHLIQCEPPG